MTYLFMVLFVSFSTFAGAAAPEFTALDEVLAKDAAGVRELRARMRTWFAETRPSTPDADVPLNPFTKTLERALVQRAEMRAEVVFEKLQRARDLSLDMYRGAELQRLGADVIEEVARLYADLRAHRGNVNRHLLSGWFNYTQLAAAGAGGSVMVADILWQVYPFVPHANGNDLADFAVLGGLASGSVVAGIMTFLLAVSPETRDFYRRYDAEKDRSRGVARAEDAFWTSLRTRMANDKILRPWLPRNSEPLENTLVSRVSIFAGLDKTCALLLAERYDEPVRTLEMAE